MGLKLKYLSQVEQIAALGKTQSSRNPSRALESFLKLFLKAYSSAHTTQPLYKLVDAAVNISLCGHLGAVSLAVKNAIGLGNMKLAWTG